MSLRIRRGSAPVVVPPGGTVYGPTIPLATGTLAVRVQAVRDGTAPLAVTHPGGTPTVVNPGDSIAGKITTAGVGGTLWFVKGTHTLSAAVAVQQGQTWVLESAAGYTRTPADSAVIDGGSTATAQGAWINVTGVTIKGGLWQHQGALGSPNAAAPIQSTNLAHNLLVQDAIIRDNYQMGLVWGGNNSVARRCYITNNGRQGFSASDGTNAMLDACRMSFNNTRGEDPGAFGSEAGTMKVASLGTDNFIVRSCWIHDNIGFGAWMDSASSGCGYLHNVAEHNKWPGLFMENAPGGQDLFGNFVKNNGYDTLTIGGTGHGLEVKSQVLITGSDQTQGTGIRGKVHRNVIDYDDVFDANRGGLFLFWNHSTGLPNTKNWDVYENQFWLRNAFLDRRVGGIDNDPDVFQLWDGDVHFYDNEYQVASASVNYWRWDSGTGQGVAKSYAQWQTYHPGDNRLLVVT